MGPHKVKWATCEDCVRAGHASSTLPPQSQQPDNAWFQTYSGHAFPLWSFSKDDFKIEDIAHSLALQCRYNGHCKWHYSVAQHSIYVMQCLKEELMVTDRQLLLAGLLHDAAETYIGDMIRPRKETMPEYQHQEHDIEAVLFPSFFGISFPLHSIIKRADNIILATEKEQIVHNPPPRPWVLPEKAWAGLRIEKWFPELAEERFLQAFVDLS